VLRARLAAACAGTEQLLGHHREANDRLLSALDELPDPSSPQAVELMLSVVGGAFYRSDYESMRTMGARALEAARALDDESLALAATAGMAVAGAFGGWVEEGQAHRAEAAAMLDGLPDAKLGLRLDAVSNLAAAELYLDHFNDAAEHAARGLALARATGQGEFFPALIPIRGATLWIMGRVKEAAEVLDDGAEAARLSGNEVALGWNLLNRSLAWLTAGDVDKAVETAEAAVEATRGVDRTSLAVAHAAACLAHALSEAGRPERAIEVFVTGAGGPDLPLIPGGWRASYLELLTRCCLAAGRTEAADEYAARAQAVAERTGLEFAVAMAQRAAAAVAHHRGDFSRAAELAQQAAVNAEKVGVRVEAAVCRLVAGRALGAGGHEDAAVKELEHAASEFDACGALRLRSQAEQELRKLGRRVHRRSAPGEASGGLAALTEREAEIARLVVDRYTNPEIARELFLSVKTIETHMRNIFRKLGVTTRVEVARALERG
jgi:DNA-binding CsgD family transcriptional regulator